MRRSDNLLFLLFVLILTGCLVTKDPYQRQLKQYQKGILKEDTSFVYHLPYETCKSHLMVQGYFSRYTHRHRAALDFKMKRGTKVCAARAGVVVRARADGNKGGFKKKYRPYGNYIVIQHADSSRAGYWHLKYNSLFVQPGDTVAQGQVIALSGNTGYTAFPHLHFLVWKSTENGNWTPFGTRFQTSKSIRYLRPFRFYRRPAH